MGTERGSRHAGGVWRNSSRGAPFEAKNRRATKVRKKALGGEKEE